MSFIAITYGFNQYSIFNTNVATNPLLDNILSTCLDEMINLLNSKLPLWDEQLNIYNSEEDQIKKILKKLETDKLLSQEKSNEASKSNENVVGNANVKINENNNSKSNNSNNNNYNKRSNAGNNVKANVAVNSKFYVLSFFLRGSILNYF